ncbi:MAG TPA: hypothetical protein VFL89_03665 [Solirubrobacterales bacterium]|nr:hypothetical protein [Solirubrobacterales bacterium]
MSLDGLRAWIGEVERKLDTRTRIFLVLAVIAVGGAAAGIYLGIDARNNEVSKSDLQATQRQIEERLGGSNVAQLEADLKALEAEVEELKGGGTAGQTEGGAGAGGKAGRDEGVATGGTGATGKQGTEGASNGSVPPQKLKEAIEKAQKESEEAAAGK